MLGRESQDTTVFYEQSCFLLLDNGGLCLLLLTLTMVLFVVAGEPGRVQPTTQQVSFILRPTMLPQTLILFQHR